MNYPEPQLQDVFDFYLSRYYSIAYLCTLLGKKTNWESVKNWSIIHNVKPESYLELVCGFKPVFQIPRGNSITSNCIAYANCVSFKQWVKYNLNKGYIAYAIIPLEKHTNNYIIILSCDDEYILCADSKQGLINQPWDNILMYKNSNNYSTRIESWFKLK